MFTLYDYDIVENTPDWTIESMVSALGAALNVRDLDTYAHSQRVICYALTLGRILCVSEPGLLTLKRGVYLHDVGKMYVPDEILRKAGQLSESEWLVMRQHPAIGYRLVNSIPSLHDAARIVLTHHEWYDGTGYPHGLSGDDIPLGARIFSVVDTLDAITSDRPYRRPVSFEEARDYIRSESGTHFDPLVVDGFLAIQPEEWRRIKPAVSRTRDLPH